MSPRTVLKFHVGAGDADLMIPKTFQPVVKDETVDDPDELVRLITESGVDTGVIRITVRADSLLDVFIVILNGRVVHLEIEDVLKDAVWRGEEALKKFQIVFDAIEERYAVVDVFKASEEEVEELLRFYGVHPDSELELTDILPEPMDKEFILEEVGEEILEEGLEEEEASAEEAESEVKAEVEASESKDREAMVTKTYEFSEESSEIEQLSREEILKKYGITEPDESFVESILESFMGVRENVRDLVSRVLRGYGITMFRIKAIVDVQLGEDAHEEEIVETIKDFMRDMGVDELEVRTYGG